MRIVDLEALVQSAVEARQAGRPFEDDRLEFKSEWVDPAKAARQIAGLANALRGTPIVYVVGVEEDGTVIGPGSVDPSDWVAQVHASFDSTPPELLRHINVQVGDKPQDTVAALVFDTELFPYVMVVQGVSDRREVPIRVGTATKSANRYQLVRMLQPTLALPALKLSEVSISASWLDTPVHKVGTEGEVGRELRLVCMVKAQVFVEHLGSRVVSLPVRDMHARIRYAERAASLTVTAHDERWRSGSDRPPPQFGVYLENDFVIATAPGEFSVHAQPSFPAVRAPSDLLSDEYEAFASSDFVALDLAFRVVGADRVVRLSAALARSEDVGSQTRRGGVRGETLHQVLGTWELSAPREDPWENDD